MGVIYKGLWLNGEISVSAVDCTDVTQTAMNFHRLSRTAAKAMGRTFTVAAFMASQLKNDSDCLTVTVGGDGEGGKIVVCADSGLSLKGYADNPTAGSVVGATDDDEVSKFVGGGRITVVKNLGLKEPYVGSSEIVSGNIRDDFVAYFLSSEQQRTKIYLENGFGGSVAASGGVILQEMPQASPAAIKRANEAFSELSDYGGAIDKFGVYGVIDRFFPNAELNRREVAYRCDCSRERIERALIALGKSELETMLEEDGKISVECQFCPQKYVFDKDDIEKLVEESRN